MDPNALSIIIQNQQQIIDDLQTIGTIVFFGFLLVVCLSPSRSRK